MLNCIKKSHKHVQFFFFIFFISLYIYVCAYHIFIDTIDYNKRRDVKSKCIFYFLFADVQDAAHRFSNKEVNMHLHFFFLLSNDSLVVPWPHLQKLLRIDDEISQNLGFFFCIDLEIFKRQHNLYINDLVIEHDSFFVLYDSGLAIVVQKKWKLTRLSCKFKCKCPMHIAYGNTLNIFAFKDRKGIISS